MNNVSLIGNLTRDPEIRWSNDLAIARFSIAINRVPGRDGQDRGADYPNIVVFGKQAENCEKYLAKGRKVAIQGHLQTGSYEKDGRKVYTTDVVVDRVEFLTPHNQEASAPQSYDSDVPQGFEAIVEFMGKPESDTTQENLLNRLERLIFQISMVANISDENFGTASGISLKYKLQAMSNLEKTKERKFEKGMNRRYKLLFSNPASKVPADSYVQLNYRFTPNIPANLLEEADIATKLEGITSQETQLKVLSIVDNVQSEIDKIDEENKPPTETIIDKLMFNAGGDNNDQ